MGRQLDEICKVWHILENPPVVYAGDIFDKWNSPPELINFALEHLPKGYAVPGQHDLPCHLSKDIKKSAFWTLVETERVEYIAEGTHSYSHGVMMHGFPWGAKLHPQLRDFREREGKPTKHVHIAVVHKYCWLPTHNPSKEVRGPATDFMNQLKGFNAIAVGDNHSGFILNRPNQSLINCGTFFRRRTDERNYRPMVGLLLASGKIVPYYMDVSQDKFIEQAEKLEELQYSGFSEFVTELERLESDGLDFVDALTRAMKTTVGKEGRKLILEALEGAKG